MKKQILRFNNHSKVSETWQCADRKCRKLDSELTENFHLNMETLQPCLGSLHVNRQCCISDEKVRSRVLITIKLVSYWRYIGNLKDEKCKMNPEICRRTNLLNEYMSKQQSNDYERSILFEIQAIMSCWFSSRSIPTLLNLSVFAFWVNGHESWWFLLTQIVTIRVPSLCDTKFRFEIPFFLNS